MLTLGLPSWANWWGNVGGIWLEAQKTGHPQWCSPQWWPWLSWAAVNRIQIRCWTPRLGQFLPQNDVRGDSTKWHSNLLWCVSQQFRLFWTVPSWIGSKSSGIYLSLVGIDGWCRLCRTTWATSWLRNMELIPGSRTFKASLYWLRWEDNSFLKKSMRDGISLLCRRICRSFYFFCSMIFRISLTNVSIWP